MSLKFTLEQLGFGPCHHMIDLLANAGSRQQAWQDAAQGNPDWPMIFEGYRAAVDYPVCVQWRELAEFYPDSKVVLTVRDENEWFESAAATIFSRRLRACILDSPLEDLFEKWVWGGHGRRVLGRGLMTAEFREHNDAVRRTIAPERPLVYDVAQGWPLLCRFLGVAEPDMPFPHINVRARMLEMIELAEDLTRHGGDIDEIAARIDSHFETEPIG